MKVKIFSRNEYYEDKERDINNWLASHPGIKIIKMLQSQSDRKECEDQPVTISIWYND